jgi:serine protease
MRNHKVLLNKNVLATTVLAIAAGAATAGGPAALDRSAPEPKVSQMILKFRADAVDMAALRAAASASGVRLSKLRDMAMDAQVHRLDKALSMAQARRLAAALSRVSGVDFAEPDQILQADFTPNDPLYGSAPQWHYFEATGGIRAPEAWDVGNGAGAVVAVIDTGYRPHADLVANIIPGYDMISDVSVANDGNGRDADASDPGDWTSLRNSSWHGTHVAGTIAAVTNNGVGVAGVAFGAQVMPVRVLGTGGGFTSDIADGIVWASGGHVPGVPDTSTRAQVINMSLGGTGPCSSALKNAINGAVGRGTVVVASAGNSSINASNQNPANCPNTITVAATGRNGGRASYSNFGKVVEIAGPGGSGSNYVWSTLNNGTTVPTTDAYAGYQGTSMASPHVAAVAALMMAKSPTMTPAQVTSTLRSTARAFPAACNKCGSGIVDAAAALAATP